MAREFESIACDAVSLITHDLRGVASALSLRALVLSTASNARDRESLTSLANEIIDIDTLLHLVHLQGPKPIPINTIERRISGLTWWKIAMRLTSIGLPRGSRQSAQCDGVELQLRDASL